MSEKLASLYVEVVAKGLLQVQTDVDRLRGKITSLNARKLKVEDVSKLSSKSIDDISTKVDRLNKKKIKVDEVAGTKVLAGKDVTRKVKVDQVGSFGSETTTAAMPALDRLQEAIEKIGTAARLAFTTASASAAGFFKQSEPVVAQQQKIVTGLKDQVQVEEKVKDAIKSVPVPEKKPEPIPEKPVKIPDGLGDKFEPKAEPKPEPKPIEHVNLKNVPVAETSEDYAKRMGHVLSGGPNLPPRPVIRDTTPKRYKKGSPDDEPVFGPNDLPPEAGQPATNVPALEGKHGNKAHKLKPNKKKPKKTPTGNLPQDIPTWDEMMSPGQSEKWVKDKKRKTSGSKPAIGNVDSLPKEKLPYYQPKQERRRDTPDEAPRNQFGQFKSYAFVEDPPNFGEHRIKQGPDRSSKQLSTPVAQYAKEDRVAEAPIKPRQAYPGLSFPKIRMPSFKVDPNKPADKPERKPSGGKAPPTKDGCECKPEQGAKEKPISNIGDAASKAMAGLATLGDAINKIGAAAQANFLKGAVAIAGFTRAADPAGFQRLQGTLGAIAVQIGSIFLPILDDVQKGMNAFLGVLRGLTNEQQDSIVHWTKMIGAALLVAAVLPKIIGLIQGAALAFRVLGAVVAVATGGIVPLLAILASVAVGFALFESSAEEGVGVLDTLKDSVGPLIDGFKTFGASIMQAMQPVVDAVKECIPSFVALGETILSGLQPVVGLVTDVARAVGSVLGNAIKTFVPILNDTIKVVVDLFGSLVGIITPLIDPIANLFNTVVTVAGKSFERIVPMAKAAAALVSQVFAVIVPIFESIVEAVDSLLTSAEPFITAFADFTKNSFLALAAVIGGVIEGLKPVWDGIVEIIQTIGDTFSVVFDMISEVLSAFGADLELTDDMFTKVFDGIKEALLAIKPIFTALIDFIRDELVALGMVLVYVGSLMKSIATGKFSGAMDRAAVAAVDFEDRVKNKGKKREEDKKQKKEDKEWDEIERDIGKDADSTKERKKGRHVGSEVPKTELIGIGQLWQRAQTSSVETPEMAMQRERNRKQDDQINEAKKTNELLKDIKDKDDGGSGGTWGKLAP